MVLPYSNVLTVEDIRRKKKYLWFRFPTDPIFFCRPYYFFNANECATIFSPGGCGLLVQRAKMASVVTLIIEPNCLNSSIGINASLVNIAVGTLLQIAQQKTANHEKNIQKKYLFPTYRRYETGTTGIFFFMPKHLS